MVVAGLAGYTNVGRAHEVANEVRRVGKQLKECQEMAQLYNNRERLFGKPVSNVRKCAVRSFPTANYRQTFDSDFIVGCGPVHGVTEAEPRISAIS